MNEPLSWCFNEVLCLFCSSRRSDECMGEDSSSHRCLRAQVVVDDSGERIRGTRNITRSQISETNTNTHDNKLCERLMEI